jgi:hypothetical protein
MRLIPTEKIVIFISVRVMAAGTGKLMVKASTGSLVMGFPGIGFGDPVKISTCSITCASVCPLSVLCVTSQAGRSAVRLAQEIVA